MVKFKIYSSIIIFLISSMIGISILLENDSNSRSIAYAVNAVGIDIPTSEVTTTTTEEITTTTTNTTTSTTNSTTTKSTTKIITTTKPQTTTTKKVVNNYLKVSGTDKVFPLKKGNGSYSDITHGNKYAVLDNRVNIDDKKIIIYGHSFEQGGGLFNYFQNYDGNQSFHNNHKYLEINYEEKNYKYEIFSVYVQGFNNDVKLDSEELEYFSDFNYSYRGWQRALYNYKYKAQYPIDMTLYGDDHILIIQTCSTNKEYTSKYDRANLLIFAKLISE